MFLKNIRISNFKAIEEMKLEFEKGFNIIIGDNGVGKTSILEAISVTLGGFLRGIDGVDSKNFSKDEIRCISELIGSGSWNMSYVTPIKVDCEVELDGKNYSWTRRKNSIKSSRSTVEPTDICKKATQLVNDRNSILPLLNYQSVARMWVQKREKKKNIFKRDDFSRSVGYIDCLSQEANNKLFLNWCRKMEQVSWQEDKKIDEYEAVKSALAKFMSIMNNRNVNRVFYDKKQDELVYMGNGKISPISYLSSGYQSSIWMALEIAYRTAVLNPDLLGEVTNKTYGIVLIDELDLHLHSKWQWKVIEALQSTFPKVQFIATTHSPIILASCKNVRVISIDEKMNVEYKNSLYGSQVNDVLEVYQNSNNIVLDIKNRLKEFYEYIESEDYNNARKILKALIDELGENNPEVVGAKVTLDLESSSLED